MKGVELTGPCPYCSFVFAAKVRDIRGEMRVERCLDCKQLFVFEAMVPRIELRTHKLATVDVGKTLDELGGVKPTKERERNKGPIVVPRSRVQEVNGKYGNGPEKDID